MGTTLIIVLVVAAVVAVVIFGGRWEKKRREALRSLAGRLRLRYTQRDDSVTDRYEFLDDLQRGSNPYAFNILAGDFEGHPVKVFDFHYETHSTDSKGRRQTHHHYFSFFLLEHEADFPELRVYAESFFSKLGQLLGFEDIDFESVEFSKAFTVKSKDKKFAFDVCHTRMMEYLLNHQDLSMEIEGGCVAISFPHRLAPEEIEGRLRQLLEIRTLFPEYLFRS